MQPKNLKKIAAALISCGMLFAAAPAGAGTLDDVLNRGEVKCGALGTIAGFSHIDEKGRYLGLDSDTCRAIAAMTLGDAEKAAFVSMDFREGLTALPAGEVDVLPFATTHTLTRDGSLGMNFTYYNFIDGQGFLARKSLGVKSAKELDGARVCVLTGTTSESNLADFFRANGMSFTPKGYDDTVQTREAFDAGACDVLTSDKSQLAAIRSELKDPSSAVILPETVSKEPLGPVVRQGDDEWANVVRWAIYAMLNAEELGVPSANVDEMKSSDNPAIRRLLGAEGGMCGLISDKLPEDCFYSVIRQVGNYGEIYEANVGENTPIGIPRAGSPNALWSKGGVLYAPPMR